MTDLCLLRIFARCGVVGVLTMGLTGCEKKARVEQRLAETREVLGPQEASLLELQKALAAMPPVAGHPTAISEQQLRDLQSQLQSTEAEIPVLMRRKAELERLNRESQERLDQYLAKHGTP